MDKFKEIRPTVLNLAIKDHKLLVGKCFDESKNKYFYRCLDGGIEFLEKSSDALKREFLEEIHADIIIKDFLGISENIFTYKGKNAHELVLIYRIDIPDEYYKEEYHIVGNKADYMARWIDIDDFKNKSKILYPEDIFLKYPQNTKQWKSC